MSLMFSKICRPRVAVMGWAILWLLIVPLIHVHPETDHHHGNADHAQGVTVHTVFSPDLEGEYEAHTHDSSNSAGGVRQSLGLTGHSPHTFSHPEIAFSLLSPSIDRPVVKPGVVVADIPDIERTPGRRIASVSSSLSVISPTILFLSTGLPLRAPPFLSL